MTYDEAIDFFLRYGRVGRDAEDLKSIAPTEAQLNEAVRAAVNLNNQTLALSQEAATAIRQRWAKGWQGL